MIDKGIIEYVANLAKIDVKPQEMHDLEGQMAKILGYIDKLKELNVEGVEPMRGAIVQRDVFRADKPVSFGGREDILNNAPASREDYFKVPRIID